MSRRSIDGFFARLTQDRIVQNGWRQAVEQSALRAVTEVAAGHGCRFTSEELAAAMAEPGRTREHMSGALPTDLLGHTIVLSTLGASEADHFESLASDRALPVLSAFSRGERCDVLAIAAESLAQPLGLAVVALPTEGDTVPDLVSLGVANAAVFGRVGTAMLRRCEKELRARGMTSLEVSWEAEDRSAGLLEALLDSCGFPAAAVWGRRYTIEHHPERAWQGPWQRHGLLPRAFRVGLWRDLTEADRESIRARQRNAVWYPEDLSPFSSKSTIEPANSLALWYGDVVVGWQINHRLDADTLQYTASFVREDLQPFGLVIPLLLEANRRHPDGCRSVFRIPIENREMIGLVERYERPYIDALATIMKTVKSFA